MLCFASTFPVPGTQAPSIRFPRPIRAIGPCVRAGIVARNALIAHRALSRGLPALCICRTQVNTSEQSFYSTHLDIDIAGHRSQLTGCCGIT